MYSCHPYAEVCDLEDVDENDFDDCLPNEVSGKLEIHFTETDATHDSSERNAMTPQKKKRKSSDVSHLQEPCYSRQVISCLLYTSRCV